MIIVTVTRWKRKLLCALLGVFFILGLSLWFSETALTGKLEDDVLNQPIRVQGEPGVIPK